jgi:hypothetical protein
MQIFFFAPIPKFFSRRSGKPRKHRRAPACATLASSASCGGVRKATRVTSAANSAWPRVRVGEYRLGINPHLSGLDAAIGGDLGPAACRQRCRSQRSPRSVSPNMSVSIPGGGTWQFSGSYETSSKCAEFKAAGRSLQGEVCGPQAAALSPVARPPKPVHWVAGVNTTQVRPNSATEHPTRDPSPPGASL